MRANTLLALLPLLLAVPCAACEMAGPNTHVGTITALDAPNRSVSLKDAQSGRILHFAATPKVLDGLAVRDQVSIEYAADKQGLAATSIKKD